MRQITLTTVNDCYSETFPISNAMFDSVQFLPSGIERLFAIVILLNARHHFPDGEYTGVYSINQAIAWEIEFTFIIDEGVVFQDETHLLEADGVAVIR